jgi:hypothetical protein
MLNDRPEYEVRLRAEPPRGWLAPPVVRLRIALKVLLRAFGFRAVEVREVTPDGQATPARPAGQGAATGAGPGTAAVE